MAIDKLLKLNDGGTAVSASGVGDYTLDLNALTNAFGTATGGFNFSDGAHLTVYCPTVGTGATTGTNSYVIELRTSATVAALTSAYDTFTINPDLEGVGYTAGKIVFSGTCPIPLKRYVGLFFTETGTATIFVDAWIGTPFTKHV